MSEEAAKPRQGADRDCLAYASTIGSLVDRTNYWIAEGVQNLTRYMSGELSYHRYRELEAELLSGLRFEVLRGQTGELLLREGMADVITGLRELDFRAATFAAGLKALRGQLDDELSHDRAA